MNHLHGPHAEEALQGPSRSIMSATILRDAASPLLRMRNVVGGRL